MVVASKDLDDKLFKNLFSFHVFKLFTGTSAYHPSFRGNIVPILKGLLKNFFFFFFLLR